MAPVVAHGRTARLSIEALAAVHADALHHALDDPRVGTHIGGPDVTSSDDTRRRIELLSAGAPPDSGQTWCNWAVLLERTVIGRLEATLHDGIAELAYVVGPRWWRRGFATEAASWMVDTLSAHVASCWATVHPANAASAHLLGRLGFVQEEPDVVLLSYDPGDLTFVRRRASVCGPAASGTLEECVRRPSPAITSARGGVVMSGNMDEAKGRIKEAAGDLTDNDSLKSEGKVDKVAGKAKGAIDSVKDKLTGKE